MTTTLVFAAKRLIGSLKHVISMGFSLMHGLCYISVDIALVAISAAALKRAVISFKSVWKLDNLYDGAKVTSNEALDMADEFLGPGYKDIGNGRFVSADGTRQVIIEDADIYMVITVGDHT